MNTIKNIHMLELLDNDLKRLEFGASLHLRMSNIRFKIIEVTEHGITLRVAQGKHLSENYADKKALVELARELFQKFFPDKKIHPQAIAYKANPITQITAKWVKQKMESLNLGVNDIVKDTGVDKTNISAWANGTRPMSQPVKAMFYHYLNSVQREKKGLRVSA
jgi:hypothetical protein